MAIRTDVTVSFRFSPRLTSIAAPSTNITLQDLNDSLRNIEANLDSMDDARLIDAAGKTDIGGGKATGITGTLRDNQVNFGTRVNRVQTGTVTTASTNGDILIDAAADLTGNGVARGYFAHNITDNSWSSILQVDSTIQAQCLALTGGSDNQFSTSDSYEIYETVECTISDGNAVAIDSSGNALSPLLPTFGVFLSRELSVSPTLVESGVSGLTPAESTKLDVIFDQLTNVEGVFDHQAAMRLILASAAGELSGATSTDVTIFGAGSTIARIIAGVDGNGNRLTLAYNVST